MSDVDDSSRWVNTELDDEFLPCFESFLEIVSIDDVGDSLGEEVVGSGIHKNLIIYYWKILIVGAHV